MTAVIFALANAVQESRHVPVARLIFGVIPAFVLGVWLIIGVAYSYCKGETAWKYGPVSRDESPVRFFALLILLGAAGVFALAAALYTLAIGLSRG